MACAYHCANHAAWWGHKSAHTGHRSEQERKTKKQSQTKEQRHGPWLQGKWEEEGFFLRRELSDHVFVLIGKIHEQGETCHSRERAGAETMSFLG